MEQIKKPAISELLRVTRVEGIVPAAAFAPDGRTYAIGFRHSRPRLFDTATGNFKQAVPGQVDHTNSLAFSPDGRLLAFSCWNNPAPNNIEAEIRVWNMRTLRTDLVIKESVAEALAFSPDGKILASAATLGNVKLWDAATGKLLAASQDGGDDFHLTFAPDGRKMVAGGQKCEVGLWDVATRKTTDYMDFAPLAVRFTPDGKTLLASDEAGIKSWDLSTKKVRETKLQEGPSGLQRQVFSPDGRWLAGGVKQNDTNEKLVVFVWEVASGKRVAAWSHEGLREIGGEEISALAFSPDGTKLLTVAGASEFTASDVISRSEIRLWDMTKVAKDRKK